MSEAGRVKSFVRARFPRAVAAYREARAAWQRPSLEKVFSEIYHKNVWNDPESVSGRGSTRARAAKIMARLPPLLEELRAQTLLDAPCGDFNWMRHTNLGPVRYVGADVVPDLIERNRRLYGGEGRTFLVLDITKGRLPRADVILCRDCLIHLSFASIRSAVANFRRSGATYLACTTHTSVRENTDCPDGGWRSVNLELPPFNFPRPLELLVEDEELGKGLGVWRLADL
ncbi:MAG: class I SAM-dependent methyltransferase [Acidobacteria bacterium]|nr:class I SAM-dependent methyltransferase [Acidobacteriota bacterium]